MVLYKTHPYDHLHPRIATVVPNYAEGIGKAVDYLALRGHKRIALIPPMRYPIVGLKGTDFRTVGYVTAIQRNGIVLDEGLICKNTESEETICQEVFNMLMTGQERPTALIVVNDYLASRIMKFIKKMGLRIPEDISIIGSDNSDVASVTTPELTTIDFSKEDLARNVVQRLMELIRGNVGMEEIFLPTKLIIREST